MAYKPNFTRKKKRKQHGESFWDAEYKNPGYLKLSTNPSDDLEKFTRWVERQKRTDVLSPKASALDAGCGNGRNLIYLAEQYGMKGVGYDISKAAVIQAARASHGLDLSYTARSIAGPLSVPDDSQELVLDMMTSHFLKKEERGVLRDEIFRVLAPGGLLFMKTFLKDGDLHTPRLLHEFPSTEEGAYIHPVMGVQEYVYTEDELVTFLQERFIIHKIYRSHKHSFRGEARKRRTITIYAEKDRFAK